MVEIFGPNHLVTVCLPNSHLVVSIAAAGRQVRPRASRMVAGKSSGVVCSTIVLATIELIGDHRDRAAAYRHGATEATAYAEQSGPIEKNLYPVKPNDE